MTCVVMTALCNQPEWTIYIEKMSLSIRLEYTSCGNDEINAIKLVYLPIY